MHSPIFVDGDSDFAAQALSEGWPGSGTKASPYIINGLEIDATGSNCAVDIRNTRTYFTLSNCQAFNASYHGLYLYNVSNALIDHCNSSGNFGYGVWLCYSSGNTVTNSSFTLNSYAICSGSSGYGPSNDNILTHNICTESDGGIVVCYSSENIVAHNVCNWNRGGGGVMLDSAENTLVSNNTMLGDGILVYGSSLLSWTTNSIEPSNTVNARPVRFYCNVSGISVPGDAGQVILANCTSMLVENQNLSHATSGIQLGFSNKNVIRNNNCSNNSVGLSVSFADENQVLCNDCSDCSEGIHATEVVGNNITSNDCSRAAEDGIYISYGSLNIIGWNHCFDCAWDGIYLWVSDDNHVVNNTCSMNRGQGVRLGQSDGNFVEDNTCLFNSLYGVYVTDSHDNTVSNNICSFNLQNGIALLISIGTKILGNIIEENFAYGISITGGGLQFNQIWNNSMKDNNGAGSVYNPLNSQGNDNGSNNSWNYGGYGNYWSDWQSPDANEDGIVDAPYGVSGSAGARDYYPQVIRTSVYYPTLIVSEPIDGSVVNECVVTVSGSTDSNATLSVNGILAAVDPLGDFSLQVALFDGPNTITVNATSPSGNWTTVILRVTYSNPIYELRDLLDQATAELNATQSRLDDLSALLAVIWALLNTTQDQQDLLKAQILLLEGQLNATLDDLNAAEGNVTSLQTLIIEMADDLSATSAGLNSTVRALEALRLESNSTHDELNTTIGELLNVQSELTSTAQKLNYTVAELAAAHAALNFTQTSLMNSQAQLLAAQNALNDMVSEFENAYSMLNMTQADLAGTQEELDETHSALNTTQSDLISARADVQGLKDQTLILRVLVVALIILVAIVLLATFVRRRTDKVEM
jgi:parallel beta-helix repeat protein